MFKEFKELVRLLTSVCSNYWVKQVASVTHFKALIIEIVLCYLLFILIIQFWKP